MTADVIKSEDKYTHTHTHAFFDSIESYFICMLLCLPKAH